MTCWPRLGSCWRRQGAGSSEVSCVCLGGGGIGRNTIAIAQSGAKQRARVMDEGKTNDMKREAAQPTRQEEKQGTFILDSIHSFVSLICYSLACLLALLRFCCCMLGKRWGEKAHQNKSPS